MIKYWILRVVFFYINIYLDCRPTQRKSNTPWNISQSSRIRPMPFFFDIFALFALSTEWLMIECNVVAVISTNGLVNDRFGRSAKRRWSASILFLEGIKHFSVGTVAPVLNNFEYWMDCLVLSINVFRLVTKSSGIAIVKVGAGSSSSLLIELRQYLDTFWRWRLDNFEKESNVSNCRKVQKGETSTATSSEFVVLLPSKCRRMLNKMLVYCQMFAVRDREVMGVGPRYVSLTSSFTRVSSSVVHFTLDGWYGFFAPDSRS